MITLKHVYVCDNEMGEVEAMFDGIRILSAWSCNDATWRNEYFAPIFQGVGITVKAGAPTKSELDLIRHWLGF